MKIGVSSYSFQTLLKRGMTYFEACQHARDMGYDGIEFIDLDLAFAPGEDNVESLAKHLRAHCEALDLDIPAYTVAADFLNGRGGAPEDEPARVCRCVDIAALLGAKVLRHDAFWRLGELRDWREGVARVVPGIRQVADYAQSLGIRTCTENHGFIFQDAERVETLIRAVDHPNYGWLVDMGNFLCADDNPLRAVPIAAPYAFHVHVKDFLVKPAEADDPGDGWFRSRAGAYLRGTVAGHGVVPVRRCLQSLKAAGYQGVVSYEFEGMEENLPALESALKFIRRALAD